MSGFDLSQTRAQFADAPALADAAQEISKLVDLWPLTDAAQIDNDVKYGEELQVRVTREIAARLCPESVTIPDAEYVYEGGVEQIPGRPDSIARVLLKANDAYDDVSGFSEDHDSARITSVGQTLGLQWSAADQQALDATVKEAYSAAQEAGDDSIENRLALVAAAYMGVLSLGEAFSSVALLFTNELNEIVGLPHTFVSTSTTDKLRELAGSAAQSGSAAQMATDFINLYAQAAGAEAAKHRDDVEWDPAMAKKKAKEEDEAKNKAQLAAKFSHVNNDEGKEHVEL